MDTNQKEIDLVEIWEIIWKRKWRIIIPTVLAIVAAAAFAFMKAPVWEVDAILLPSKFFMQTAQGQFIEVVVTEPKQIAGQINQASYNNMIAAELKMNIKDFPKIRAENLSDTQLVRVLIKDEDTKQAKAILLSLFSHLKRELDRKIDVEMKSIDTQITTKANGIKDMENEIQVKDFDIKSLEIEKDRIKGEIEANKNKLVISEERSNSLLEEMKSVKGRIDDIDKQLKNVLSQKKEEGEAVSLLLYSNEVQQNLRYYSTLDEKLSLERVSQENLRLDNKDNEEKLKQIDTKIGQTKAEIANIKNQISTTQSEIKLLEDEKQRIDYAQLIKAPTASVYPVSPRVGIILAVTAIIGLMVFTLLAFLWEYTQRRKPAQS
jgi:LPS O-antigen subunit length determinant protein (WzzB/FepE family)